MVLPRRAAIEDIPAIARIHRLAFFDAMPHMPVLHTSQEDLSFYTTVVFPRADIWLIEATGATAGFVAFRSGWIDHLYIHPAHQRRGFGSQLLAVAKSENHALNLWTFQCNQQARHFYEKHGFRAVKMTDGTDNEERQPDALYAWTRDSLTDIGNA